MYFQINNFEKRVFKTVHMRKSEDQLKVKKNEDEKL